MLTIIILNILAVACCILGYTTYNLLVKNEKLEDLMSEQQQYIDNLSNDIFYCEQRIEELDRLGAFSSDDEIGWFFEEIKKMSETLKRFIIK